MELDEIQKEYLGHSGGGNSLYGSYLGYTVLAITWCATGQSNNQKNIFFISVLSVCSG